MDISGSPYFDDYSAAKYYTQILAVPGRVPQAREFTQMQTMIKDYLKRTGNAVIKNGGIIDGCTLVIQGTTARVTAGKIFIDGLVRDFTEQTITITNSGEERIGVKIDEYLITESTDNTLLDPAVGHENYMQAGAHRLKEVPLLVLNDDSSVVLYRLQDGVLVKEASTSETDRVLDIMAKRTYDESGNYKVSGLELSADLYNVSPTNVYCNLSAGKAYVKGYEITKPVAVSVLFDKALTYRSRLAEPHTFHTGTDFYALTSQPVKSISAVRALVQTSESRTRGSTPGGIDYLSHINVDSVVSVVQGGTTYVLNTDYILTNDGIDWSPAGSEPSPGTSYNVTYIYLKTMTPTTDYTLTSVDDVYGVDFSPSGDNPVNNTSFQTDYDFYLARKDVFGIDRNGNIIIAKGEPDTPLLVKQPVYINENVLNLGVCYLPPNSDTAEVTNYAVTRIDMETMWNLLKRLEALEYNQALDDLDKEALSDEQATNLRGVFTDGFIGFTKADVNHSAFDSSIDIAEGELTISYNESVHGLAYQSGNLIGRAFSSLITAPFNEVLVKSQLLASKGMLVNPYAVYNVDGLVLLTPSGDSWIETTNLKVSSSNVSTQNVTNWWLTGGNSWQSNAESALAGSGWSQAGEDINQSTYTRNRVVTEKILDEAIMYMRQVNIQIEASRLTPSADNLVVYFDGIKVTCTALPAYTGTQAGTLKADATGYTKGSFTIPANVKTGTREVKITNINNVGVTSFKSEGRLQKYRETTTKETIILRRTQPRVFSDPLAQSFMFMEDVLLTAVGIYFSVKDATLPIVIQIKEMINGYPTGNILAEKTLLPADITVSANSSIETKVTFDDPVLCKSEISYAIVVLTESTAASVYVAEMNRKDLLTNNMIQKQPYVEGVLFSSSNATTWTAHQEMDMKFKIYGADFVSNGQVTFDVVDQDATRAILAVESAVMEGAAITWSIKKDSGDFEPINPYTSKEFDSMASTLQVKVNMNRASNTKAAPLISKDYLQMVVNKNKLEGDYVSKNVVMADSFRRITQYVDLYLPSGTSALIQFATDTTGTSWVSPSSIDTIDLGNGWVRYVFQYTYTLGNEKYNFRSRIHLETNNVAVKPKARRLLNILSSS